MCRLLAPNARETNEPVMEATPDFQHELVRRAPDGLRAIFSCCHGFASDTDLMAVDLEKNTRIRRGLESSSISEQEAREWVALL